MKLPALQSLVCPALIGRKDYLEFMISILVEAGAGRSQTIFLSGEAGWGKSRLVNEFKATAVGQGWRCVQGNCFESERSLPFAPVSQIIHNAGLEQIPEQLAPFFSAAAGAAVYDKHQLFFALTAFLADLTATQPLLFIVEDLHWCDDASLELLLSLSRRLHAQSILFLVTFRNNEIHASLAHYLSQMERERRAVEIRLAPLTRSDASLMVQSIFNQSRPARTEFMDVLYPLTEGNPFYIEETLKSMQMAGELQISEDGIWLAGALHDLHIPRSVQAAVQQRSAQLSAEARGLLTLAAVAGRRFDFDLLHRLTGFDEPTLLQHFKELVAAQLIVEELADRFAFRHALTREAVYVTLLARERRNLHCRIAETLEEFSADNDQHLSDLAYHFYLGQNWDKALVYARQAGERAQAVYASAAAVEHFTRALEAADHLSGDLCGWLHLKRGQAYLTLNRFESAQKDLQQALDFAREQGASRAEWEALLALGDLWATRDYAPAGNYFQQALMLVRTLDDPAALGFTLNHLGNWRMNQERPYDALRDHLEALSIFQSLSDLRGTAQTLDFLGVTSFNCGDVVQSRKYYQQALPLLQQVGDRRGLMHTLSGMALSVDFDLEVDDSQMDEAVAWGKHGLQVSREIVWRSGEALTLICLGLAYRQQGDYGETLVHFEQALDAAAEIEQYSWMADARRALGTFYLDLLDFAEARRHLDDALTIARQLNSSIWIRQSIAALVSVTIEQGEFEPAKALLEGVWQAETPMQGLQNRYLWAARIELALAMGEFRPALAWVDGLIAATKNLEPVTSAENAGSAQGGKVVPRLWQLRGEILAALGRYPEAEQDFISALAAASAQGRKGRQWRLHRNLAQVRIAQKNFTAARQSLDAARQLIAELAATLEENFPARAEHFSLQAIASLPVLPEPSLKQQQKHQFGGLTSREREIANLVARGKTNREIAEALFISERTAERHIANIMKKLDFNTRVQIAAWAIEKGLADSKPA